MGRSSCTVACAALLWLSAQETLPSITYRGGALPALPAMAVGGGEVFLEVSVNAGGRVAAVARLRTTPPFTDLVADAVRRWTFDPGAERRILVAALIRPPALQGPTLGELPQDVAPGSNGIPFPLATVLPSYPVAAHASGVVLVEARVDSSGRVIDAKVRRSSPPFDEPARTAVRLWRFRPATAGGQPVSSVAYVLLGFVAPVTTTPVIKR